MLVTATTLLTIVLDHPLPNGYFFLAVSERTVRTSTTFLSGKIPTNGKVEVAWDGWRKTAQQLLAWKYQKWNADPRMSDLATLVCLCRLHNDVLWVGPRPARVADLNDPVRTACRRPLVLCWRRFGSRWLYRGRNITRRRRSTRRGRHGCEVITRWHWWRHSSFFTLSISSQLLRLAHTHIRVNVWYTQTDEETDWQTDRQHAMQRLPHEVHTNHFPGDHEFTSSHLELSVIQSTVLKYSKDWPYWEI